ncbi:hypothetical protein N9R54_01675 [Pelobium sp.]|nr:hypothetical protein [Pelobium sp.]MDA9554919.1 hypothetical protein [Pelobium sp.]
MNASELYSFLIKEVPNFENPEIILDEGECYHYTPHWQKIKEQNKFKGAKIDCNLDQTQMINYLGEATELEGVVFAYEDLNDAREEGFGLDIIKIRYRAAIKALHKAEDALGDFTVEAANKLGIEMTKGNTRYTILILTSDILTFEFIEKAK